MNKHTMTLRTRTRLWLRIQLFIWGLICINAHTLPSEEFSSYLSTNKTTENITAAFAPTNEEDLFNSTDYSILSMTAANLEVCTANLSIGINVINRTSSMFEAQIAYNCSPIDPSELSIFFNETKVDHCSITNEFSNHIITILCDPIWKNAGRNLSLTIGSQTASNQLILNETFTITLAPLSLQTLTNISITVDPDLTSALIYIPNCDEIANLEYLLFRCDNDSDLSNNTLSDICEYTCSNLIPGTIYEASLIRLEIPIIDKGENHTAQTFAEETLTQIYRINLDTVTNFTYTIENTTVTISFAPIHGNFDDINLTCFAEDQSCSNAPTNLSSNIGNCSTCTSISISPIEKGVRYRCQASTIKEDFDDALSDEFHFSTPLEPFYSNMSSTDFIFNTSEFIVRLIPQSDFQYLQSICIPNVTFTFPCVDIRINHSHCSTNLIHKGVLGCNYQCTFLTNKPTFNASSSDHSVQIYPHTPLTIHPERVTSRSISFRWSITDEPMYVHHYEIYLNRTLVDLKSTDVLFHDERQLLPDRNYKFRVQIVSNRLVMSDPESIQTLEEVPKTPDDINVQMKVFPISDDPSSTDSQHVIEFDPSLFSDDYGLIRNYSIHVRQDQSKLQPWPDPTGTYVVAWQNPSVDYLAIFLPRSAFISARNGRRLRLIIGNETLCANNASSSIPCNGRLKPSRNYSLIIRACNIPGCTPVLSRIFQTRAMRSPPKKLPVWAIVLLIIVPSLFVVLLLVWQRKNIPRLRCRGGKSDSDEIPILPIPMEAFDTTTRPKALVEYLDITPEKERILEDEYQELEANHPPRERSREDLSLEKYDRYPKIFARGLWKRTAVRLTGRHRSHDYINANLIRGYERPKQYIACQGPLKNTRQDFWDMISENYVSKIIMLTNLEKPCRQNQSNGQVDCCLYFPLQQGATLPLNGLTVQTISVAEHPERHLQIRLISLRRHCNERRIVHYYYTGWTDFGTVKPSSLLDLIETVNEHRYSRTCQRSSAPIVVHCSAGVGRTGTYIAVDRIVQILDDPQNNLTRMKLDVMGLVHELRQDRMRMVQTKKQYLLVNRCVEEHLRRTDRIHLVTQSHAYANFPDPLYANILSLHQNSVHPSGSTSSHPYVNESGPQSSSRSDKGKPRSGRSRRPTDASLPGEQCTSTDHRYTRRDTHRQPSRSPEDEAHF